MQSLKRSQNVKATGERLALGGSKGNQEGGSRSGAKQLARGS
ncbi:hypothetical protein TIFTF001_022050 [Ficus carica]|uniref:Uncharacterized protein n=1 Tax=Ficus carica TaxID=3494 RepID=A0AA88AVD6_FICCA|nr:hypothetical protein TIFTF001_022050 [Ficus carica]